MVGDDDMVVAVDDARMAVDDKIGVAVDNDEPRGKYVVVKSIVDPNKFPGIQRTDTQVEKFQLVPWGNKSHQ